MSFFTARVGAGLTQRDVAESLGVTCPAVSRWESGKSKPRASLLTEIAKLYHCKVDDLLKERK